MKFSHRTHPIIKNIEDKTINVENLDQSFFFGNESFSYYKEQFKIYWSAISDSLNQYYVTNTFYKSFQLAKNKIIECVENQKINFIECFENINCFHLNEDKTSFICYFNSEKTHIGVLFFLKDVLLFDLYFKTKEGINIDRYADCNIIYNRTKLKPLEICDIVYEYFILSLFLKYAEVDIKHLKPKERLKDFNCKYINDTKSPIQILDSTWFTTLVRSEEFKVRGHFRLQPKKKDGEWTKELIWINEFKKQGYTRNFKKPLEV